MQLSDEQLVARFKEKKDMEAFEELVSRYETKVYNLAYRFTGNHADAGDLAQEAFIRVYRALHKFRGDSSFSTWLYRIAANVCRDELRKQKKKSNVSFDEIESNRGEIAATNTDCSPEEAVQQKDLQERVQEYINRLPDDYRLIIIMREMQELSYDEIAEALQVSLGTVKSRLSRARTALKNIVKECGEL